MNNATDFLGKPLNIGDKVIFMKLNYRNFHRGVITKITNKMVMIDDGNNSEVRQFHNQVVKV